MVRFTQQELNEIMAEFLGKPYEAKATGPDSYDCYGLVKVFAERLGMDLPDIGLVDPKDARPVYDQQQQNYEQCLFPRPFSLVTFSSKTLLDTHIGLVLPNDNLFIHCPGRAHGKVLAEPLSRRPWRDKVDGYWWAKDWIEVVIMLTPMTTSKRATQFVRAGRSLAEIIEQDITRGQDIPLHVFLDAEPILRADWAGTYPTYAQQIVIRPELARGAKPVQLMGMLALAVAAPAIMGAVAPGLTGAASAMMAGEAAYSAGTMMAYSLGTAAIMMGGALALNALVGADEGKETESQSYTWNPKTTQRVGTPVPLVYGTYGVRGVLICSYASSKLTEGTDFLTKDASVTSAEDLIHLKIAYSDGPIEGIVDGTEELNNRSIESYNDADDWVLEHFTGTESQAASTVTDAFEIPVNQMCKDQNQDDHEITKTFTAVDCDKVAIVLRFPNGLTNFDAEGDANTTRIDTKIEMRIAGGSWHTLFDSQIIGKSRDPVRLRYFCHETYEGGSAFTITPGIEYEARVSRNSSQHSDRGDNFYFDSIQCVFDTAQKHPGLAYTAIGAGAGQELSGSIDYYAQIEGKLVCIYDSGGNVTSIEWSDNPAWIAVDVATRPVISGTGESGDAYAVEYYRRMDPSDITMSEFITFATWCDEQVPITDESGDTENRYVFNGVIDSEMVTWDAVQRVCRAGCAMPTLTGNILGVVVDKPATPSQMFNVSNLRPGFRVTYLPTNEVATIYDAEFYDETGDYARESYPIPLRGAAADIPANLDCWGATKRSQVWRRATRQLRINQYMKKMVELPAAIDSIYTSLGDVIYVQHPAIATGEGGRIDTVYANGIKTDKELDVESGETYTLLIRTHDGSAERLSYYTVASVTGDKNDIVTIVGAWDYTPNEMDLWTFGTATDVVDTYRVTGFRRQRSGKVILQGMQYTTDYYTDDENAPRIEPQVYSTTKGGTSPSLLPTTQQAVAGQKPGVSHIEESIKWYGLNFTGDDVDTVTWTVDLGGGIKYQGTWVPIADSQFGETTDKYIYFDPNIGDPRYLQTTNELSDLSGEARYLFCINEGGVAFFKEGVLVAKNGSYIDADDMPISGSGANLFDETFEDAFGQVTSHWELYSSHSMTYAVASASGVAGGKVLQCSENVGAIWHKQSIPFDPSKLYRVRIRAKRTAGICSLYAGVAGRNSADTAWVDYTGAATARMWGQHYVVAVAESGDGAWEIFTGYFKGHAIGNGTNVECPDPANPGALHEDVRYFRPFLYISQSSGESWEIDEFAIDVIPEDADQIPEGGTNKFAAESGADVTANNAVDITHVGVAAPGSPQEGWVWCDTSVSPNMLKRYSGAAWIQIATVDGSWSLIVDDDGHKPEDGADVTGDHEGDIQLDNCVEGVKGAKTFHDYFQNPDNDVATRWVNQSGSGELSIQSGGVSGGKFLRVSNGQAWLIYKDSFPFDPGWLYRIRVRTRQTAGVGTAYLGVSGRNGADDAWVNVHGLDQIGSQHYIAASAESVGSGWTVYTGYFRGTGSTGDAGAKPDPGAPGILHDDVRWFRPTILVNYDESTGTVEIDEFSVDIMPDHVSQQPLSVSDFGAKGDGSDDSSSIQACINAGIASGRAIFFPQPSSYYGIGTKLSIGDGSATEIGLHIYGEGQPQIKWIGAASGTMIEMTSISESTIEDLWLHGNSTSGVNGLLITTASGLPSQRNTFNNVIVQYCPGVGVDVYQQHSNAACDYVEFENCTISYNGINTKLRGGPRQVTFRNGANLDATTYGTQIDAGQITAFGHFWANSGTSDIYLNGPIAGFHLYACKSESDVVLTTSAGAQAASASLAPNIMSGFQQDNSPAPAADVISYDMYKPLILIGCKFQQDVDLGTHCVSISSFNTEFEAGGFTGTGADDRLMYFGIDDGAGMIVGPLEVYTTSSLPKGVRIRALTDSTARGVFFANAVPDSYYYRAGEVVLHTAPTTGILGWVCTSSGDFGAESTKATFTAFGTLFGETVTAFAKTLLDDADAAAARGTLGLGTIATQDSDGVTITGGTILGSAIPQPLTDTPTAKTADYTVLTADNGKTFTNVGASRTITFTLPSAAAGTALRFIRVPSEALRVAAAGADVFAGRVTDLELGADESVVEIRCLIAGTWNIVSSFGTYSWY